MDVFQDIRRQLSQLQGEVYHLHQGKLYSNPNPLRDMRDGFKPIIEPQVHSNEGGEAPLLARIGELFLGAGSHDGQIALANGGTNALWLALKEAIRAGRPKVHALSPYWMYLPGVVEHSGGELDEVPTLDREGVFSEDRMLDAVRQRLGAASSVIYLANPANPAGNLFSPAFVASLVRLCDAWDCTLVVDHAYFGFTRDDVPGAGIPGLPAVYRGPRVLNAFTFSKLLGVPGLRLGFVHGQPERIGCISELYRYSSYTLNSYSQAIVHEYLSTPSLIGERQSRYAENREIYRSVLDGIGTSPDGGFFAFLPPVSGVTPHQIIDAGIGVVEGSYFGAAYKNWFRLCFTAEPPQRLTASLIHLERLLRS